MQYLKLEPFDDDRNSVMLAAHSLLCWATSLQISEPVFNFFTEDIFCQLFLQEVDSITSHIQNLRPRYLLSNNNVSSVLAVQVTCSPSDISHKQFKLLRVRHMFLPWPLLNFSHREEKSSPKSVCQLDVVAQDAFVVYKEGSLELLWDLGNVFRTEAARQFY